MPTAHDDPAPNVFDAWSSSTRQLMQDCSRYFVSPWLSQPILPNWRFGDTYIVSEDNSRDPGMERRILSENSYGRQLGRIMDALEVLVKHQKPADDPDSRAALKAFLELAEQIRQIKAETQSDRVGQLRTSLERLKAQCPEDFRRLMHSLPKP